MRQIFVENIFDSKTTVEGWGLTTAIFGAHTVGKVSLENSGYNGFWSDAVNQGIFNNNYYYSLIAKGWGPETSVGGNQCKNQWKLTDRNRSDPNDPNAHKEIMLNTDMCLAYVHNENHLCERRERGTIW